MERSPCWSKFVGRTCDSTGDPHWSSLFQKHCTLWKGTYARTGYEKLQSGAGLILEKIEGDCLLWERCHAGASIRIPFPEEEAAAETCDELAIIPIPHLPAPLVGRRENFRRIFPLIVGLDRGVNAFLGDKGVTEGQAETTVHLYHILLKFFTEVQRTSAYGGSLSWLFHLPCQAQTLSHSQLLLLK